MKLKSLLIVSLIAAALPAFAGAGGKNAKAPVAPAPPAEDPLTITSIIGYDTDYVFRGILFAKNLVSANVDGVYKINDMVSLNFGAWYGVSADDHAAPFAGGGSYGELDLYAAVNVKVAKNLIVGVKYTYYDYLAHASSVVEDINEVGITLATTDLPVDLIAGAYYDFTASGYYFETGVSKTIEIVKDRFSLVPAAVISYGSHYYGVNGFNHIKLQLGAPIKLAKNATLTPYVAANFPIDSLDGLGEESRIYGGIALSVSF